MFTFDANNNLNVNSAAPATQPVSGTVTANQGTANTSTNAWPVKVTDGTTVAAVIVGTTALKTDLSSVAGLATSTTGGVGIQQVGIVGGVSGSSIDSPITAATAPARAIAVSGVYQTTVPALTVGQAVALQSDTTGAIWTNKDSRRQTYRMAVRGFTPVAAAASPLFSIQGSATKTVRITHIHVSGYCSTGNALPAQISLQKFSVLTGGVTGNTPTGALQDSGNAAQTAICLQYSTIPTTATAIGGITATDMFLWLTAGATIPADFDETDFTFGDDGGQQLVLRGTAQYLGILLSAIATTSPVMSIWVEWIEDNS